MKRILSTVAMLFLFAQLAQAAPAHFLGNWRNVNRSTRNIIQAVITENPANHQLMLRAFGACSPTPCDMGSVPLMTFGRSVSDMNHKVGMAHYNFSFKQVDITIKVSGAYFILETYNHFTDNSGRQNYWTSDRFRRTPVPFSDDSNETLE